jgi:hypothetical protein
MSTAPSKRFREAEMRIEPSFVEEQRNRYAGQNLAWLILLNGAAALVILAAVAYAPQSTFETKLGAAMMVFGGGAIAGLVSSFFAYVNRTLRMEGRERPALRNTLRSLGMLAALAGGAAFLIGLNMVWDVSSSKSSSRPKSHLEKLSPTPPEPQTSPSAPSNSPTGKDRSGEPGNSVLTPT